VTLVGAAAWSAGSHDVALVAGFPWSCSWSQGSRFHLPDTLLPLWVIRLGGSGDSGCCLAGLYEGDISAGVGGLQFCGRNVAAGLIESPVVEPVDVFHGGERDLLDGGPRFDQLGF